MQAARHLVAREADDAVAALAELGAELELRQLDADLAVAGGVPELVEEEGARDVPPGLARVGARWRLRLCPSQRVGGVRGPRRLQLHASDVAGALGERRRRGLGGQ